MTPLTREWVEKAEGDFDIVLLARRSRKPRRLDGICFLCQQCAEKYLKARLEHEQQPIPKIHDLKQLLPVVGKFEPLWLCMEKEMDYLTDFAVATRYPGASADGEAAKSAFKICKRLRELVRQRLGVK